MKPIHVLLASALALLPLAGCGTDAPPVADSKILVHIGPADLSPTRTLLAAATLDGRPGKNIFTVDNVDGMFSRLGIALVEQQGALHVEFQGQDVNRCLVWHGTLDHVIPFTGELNVTLSPVNPPVCN